MKRFSLLDRCFHVAYTIAYRMMRVYWWIRRPRAHGALVAIWHDDKILLVRNSYHGYYSLPGGYVHPREPAAEAATRELKEELGLDVASGQLQQVVDMEHVWECKTEHVEMFALECDEPPKIEVDGREVISAEYFDTGAALELEMFPSRSGLASWPSTPASLSWMEPVTGAWRLGRFRATQGSSASSKARTWRIFS